MNNSTTNRRGARGDRTFWTVAVLFLIMAVLVGVNALESTAFASEELAFETIANEADLVEMIERINSQAGVYRYRLTNDITIQSNATLDAIGRDTDYKFSGEFDGNNHKISGYNTTDKGIFANVENATIHDLRVEGSVSGAKAGGFIGKATGSLNVYNCEFVGEVSGAESAGFIRVTSEDTSIVNCLYEGDIEGDYSDGFVYNIAGGATIENCVANARVKGCKSTLFSHDADLASCADCYEVDSSTYTEYSTLREKLNSYVSNATIEGLNTWTLEAKSLSVYGKGSTTPPTPEEPTTPVVPEEPPTEQPEEPSVSSYAVTYDIGDAQGSAPSDTTEYAEGASVTVLGGEGFSKEGYSFEGWSTSGDGVVSHKAGDAFEISSNVTLTAVFVLIPQEQEHTVPTITSFLRGVLSYTYPAQLLDAEELVATLYDSHGNEIASLATSDGECDLADLMLDNGKGSYYATMVVVDRVSKQAISAHSAPSQELGVYEISLDKGEGTTLNCVSLAIEGATVTVEAETYTGCQDLVITQSNQPISGSFTMPKQDVTVKTTATLVRDYVGEAQALINSLAEGFDVANYAKVKEIERLLAEMIAEQRGEVDTARLTVAKTAYDNAIESAQEDYKESQELSSVISAVEAITLASATIYLATKGCIA